LITSIWIHTTFVLFGYMLIMLAIYIISKKTMQKIRAK
jgi:hypothetical protein